MADLRRSEGEAELHHPKDLLMAAEYTVIDGFRCYAPQVAFEGADYPLDGFDVTADVEARSFWCRSRNRIIRLLFERFTDRSRILNVLEIGCGIGGVIGELRRVPNLRLTGSEVYLHGLRFARAKLPDVEFIQLDATDIPFSNEFDVVGAFDVLEHIDADHRVILNVFKALRPGGLFFVTVPQYPWMWGHLDEIVHHKRRYSRRELTEKLIEAGFDVLFVSSFGTAVFPFMFASRLMDRALRSSTDTKQEFAAYVELPAWINTFFGALMRIDETLIRAGFRLPFGGSLLAVAHRDGAAADLDSTE
jgi:SAM-dependent methyltransferase